MASDSDRSGAWAPLRVPTFRAFWLVTLGSNICTWINDVASGWLMTGLSESPLMVAMVQAATTLPIVLLALIAGALADIVDRRRYLIVTQLWMAAVAATLAVLAGADGLSATGLLALSFALGVGAALAMPAMNATTPELVPAPMLPAAVSLGSLSMNLARSIGPAVGGVLLTQAGAWAAYALNALSFVVVAVVLWRWRRTAAATALPPEHFLPAMRSGLRYARRSPPFRAVLIRAAAFFLFASSVWALLPLIARRELGGGPGTYGLLLASVGIGAVAAALLLPRIRQWLERDRMVFVATALYGLTAIGLATLRVLPPLLVVMAIAGAAWISVLSSLQVAAQTSVPAWVRGRALSVYIVVFSGGLALGSFAWGALATRIGVAPTLIVSGIGVIVATLLVHRFRLASGDAPDLAPSAHWPAPYVADTIVHDRGPVLVQIEYRVALGQRERFLATMRTLGEARRRDGAMTWGVFEDAAEPGRYIESFQVGSWLEHLRQHERTTRDDLKLQEAVRAFHVGAEPPNVSHLVGGAPSSLSPLKPGGPEP